MALAGSEAEGAREVRPGPEGLGGDATGHSGEPQPEPEERASVARLREEERDRTKVLEWARAEEGRARGARGAGGAEAVEDAERHEGPRGPGRGDRQGGCICSNELTLGRQIMYWFVLELKGLILNGIEK